MQYTYVPKGGIKTPQQLLKFVMSIPSEYWCVDTRNDYMGHRCVLGHLDQAFRHTGGAYCNHDGFTETELALANNGVIGPHANYSPRIAGAGLDGESIKKRVIALIETKL